MYAPDPTAMLRRLTSYLQSGGVIVFQEPDWQGARSWPPAPIYDRCCQWVDETFRLSGNDAHLGIKLRSIFVAAGLPAPSLRLEALVGAGAEHSAVQADLVESLLPAMERLGVATAAEVNIETLATRMQNEVVAKGSVVVSPAQI